MIASTVDLGDATNPAELRHQLTSKIRRLIRLKDAEGPVPANDFPENDVSNLLSSLCAHGRTDRDFREMINQAEYILSSILPCD